MAHIQTPDANAPPSLKGKRVFWKGKPICPRLLDKTTGESTPGLASPASAKPSAEAAPPGPDLYPGLRTLTCSLVIRIDRIFPCGANPQEGLVVIVFVPVEGQHPRASALRVATQEVRQDACQLCEGLRAAGLHEGPRRP